MDYVYIRLQYTFYIVLETSERIAKIVTCNLLLGFEAGTCKILLLRTQIVRLKVVLITSINWSLNFRANFACQI
jgi:hypothetical protein